MSLIFGVVVEVRVERVEKLESESEVGVEFFPVLESNSVSNRIKGRSRRRQSESNRKDDFASLNQSMLERHTNIDIKFNQLGVCWRECQ